jgi:hypothetical protein
MATCKRYTENILNSENIGDSLIKINNNFFNLQTALCDLQKKINNTVKVRTFFYYGPNSVSDATSGMQNNVASRPSNNTIQTFVNTELKASDFSKTNDIIYVVYQKTGYILNKATRVTSGTVTARVISFSTVVPWSTTTDDLYTTYSPVFIIWKLTFNGTSYVVDKDFPKFSQAETLATNDWNAPEKWSQY